MGSKLFYTAVGGGPAVVLLHPTPVDYRFWMLVAEILQAKYRVIVPDLRGRNITTVAKLIVMSARARKESRGLHYNIDYPDTSDEFKKDTIIVKE